MDSPSNSSQSPTELADNARLWLTDAQKLTKKREEEEGSSGQGEEDGAAGMTKSVR